MSKVSLKELRAKKTAGESITAVTAYNYIDVQMAEEAAIDILVPCDWGMATTLLGYPTALQVTMDHVLFYLHALARLAKNGLILAPMPFGSYQTSNEDTALNASRLMKGGAESIKLEGGGSSIERVRTLSEIGIPCVGHLGFTPQQTHRLGGERVVGDSAEEARQLLQDASALEEAGAWGVILQNVPERVAHVVMDRTDLITIGSGGTRGCDGHMVLLHDLLGWPQHIRPLFSVQYGDFFNRAVDALDRHCGEVQALQFPTRDHTFGIPEEEFDEFMKRISEE